MEDWAQDELSGMEAFREDVNTASIYSRVREGKGLTKLCRAYSCDMNFR